MADVSKGGSVTGKGVACGATDKTVFRPPQVLRAELAARAGFPPLAGPTPVEALLYLKLHHDPKGWAKDKPLDFKPGEKPEVTFALTADDKAVAAYEYCNLHGLWKALA